MARARKKIGEDVRITRASTKALMTIAHTAHPHSLVTDSLSVNGTTTTKEEQQEQANQQQQNWFTCSSRPLPFLILLLVFCRDHP
jgi:hypothetical protein